MFFGWVKGNIRRFYGWMTTVMEGRKQKSTIASLDGVRAIACLTVITYHISLITRSTHLWNPLAPGLLHRVISSILLSGASGVTLFFVLSGFLLFMPFAKSFLFDGKRPSTRTFYLRRVFRILPAYYTTLFLLILLDKPQYLNPGHLKQLFLFVTLFMDSTKATFQHLNGPFWTLAIEWQFYLLLPWLMLGFSLIVMRFPRRWRVFALLFCLAGVIAWGIWSREWGAYYMTHSTQTVLVPRPLFRVFLFFTYGFNGKYLEDFAVGMLVSLLYMYTTQKLSPGKLSIIIHRFSPLLFCAGLAVLATVALWNFNMWYPHSWVDFDPYRHIFNYVVEICYASGYGLCIIAILFGPVWLRSPFEWSPLRWIGMISYSLYMWHLPLLIFCIGHIAPYFQANRYAGIALYIVWVVVVVIPVAFLSYLLVEKPWVELGNRLLRRGDKPKATESKQEQARDEKATERELVRW